MMFAFLAVYANDRIAARQGERLSISITQGKNIVPTLDLLLPDDNDEAELALLKLGAGVDAARELLRSRRLNQAGISPFLRGTAESGTPGCVCPPRGVDGPYGGQDPDCPVHAGRVPGWDGAGASVEAQRG